MKPNKVATSALAGVGGALMLVATFLPFASRTADGSTQGVWFWSKAGVDATVGVGIVGLLLAALVILLASRLIRDRSNLVRGGVLGMTGITLLWTILTPLALRYLLVATYPSGQGPSVGYGWYVAIVGAFLLLLSAALEATTAPRQPASGVLARGASPGHRPLVPGGSAPAGSGSAGAGPAGSGSAGAGSAGAGPAGSGSAEPAAYRPQARPFLGVPKPRETPSPSAEAAPEPRATPAPQGEDRGFQPFWCAVPTPRVVIDPDNPGSTVATLDPGSWYAAVRQHPEGLIVQLPDGRSGLLTKTDDLFKA